MGTYSDLLKQKPSTKTSAPSDAKSVNKSAPKITREPTLDGASVSVKPRRVSRTNPRESLRELPTRDEIQEFSFRLRDELKVKVQAEVPHHWQDELEEVARLLKVKKLELYRFVIGEFLGKVKLKKLNP